MEQTATGLVAATEGWFVVNVRDAAWVTGDHFGDACIFEGEAAPFGQIGYTLAVLELAQRHGAGVAVDTGSSEEAYAPFGRWTDGPPASFDGLPWALR